MTLQGESRAFLGLIEKWFDAQQLCDIQEGLAAQALTDPDRPEPPEDYGKRSIDLNRERNEAAVAVKEAGERLAANLIASRQDAKAVLKVAHYADRNGGVRAFSPHWESVNVALQEIAMQPGELDRPSSENRPKWLAAGQQVAAPEIVTLEDVGAMMGRKAKTIANKIGRDLPAPVTAHKGSVAATYLYAELKPLLAKHWPNMAHLLR